MTSAGGPGGGGPGGMAFGDDYVAARLSIDIPEGSVEGIREITQEVERFRVTMEAATRVETDMTRYLEQMTEAAKAATQAQRDLVNTLEGYMSLTGRYGGVPGVPPSTGVPGGTFNQPFSGMSAGTGTAASGAGPSRPSSPTDIPTQLGQQQQGSPREWMNMQSARGGLTAQDVINLSPQSIQDLANKIADREQVVREQMLHTKEMTESSVPGRQTGSSAGGLGEVESRVQRATSLAGQVLNEMAPGGSALGMGSLAVRGLQWANRKSAQVGSRRDSSARGPTSSEPEGLPPEGSPGMGSEAVEEVPGGEVPSTLGSAGAGGLLGGISSKLGGLTKFLGPVAAAATAGLSIFGAVQAGGNMIQGLRNTASVRGGAAGEGFEVEAKARIMAMNPFITGDQARQIYQAVMSEGYADASGAGADNVIEFMKKNLTDMNISVADSAKMLRSTVIGNVKGDPESVAGSVAQLREELDAIRTLSRESVMSTPEYTQGMANLKDTLIAAGASPEAAARAAMTGMEVGSGDQAFKGQFARAQGGLASSPSGGALLRTFGGVETPAGLLPQLVPGYLAETGQSDEATWNTLRHFAQVFAQGDRGDYTSRKNAIYLFQQKIAAMGLDIDAARDLKAAEKLYMELLGNEEIGAANQRSGAQNMSTPSGAGMKVDPLPRASFTPNAAPAISPGAAAEAGRNSGGRTISPSPSAVGPPQAAQVSGQANVQISLTPEAQRLLQVQGQNNVRVPLSATEQASNRGVGGAARNNPRIGER